VINHISLRVPGPEHHYLLNPFGLYYGEVPSHLYSHKYLGYYQIHGHVDRQAQAALSAAPPVNKGWSVMCLCPYV
jgi:hypothetical protein